MRRFLLALCLLFCLPAYAERPGITDGSVVVVPIKGPVSEAQFFFLRRVIKQADAAKASALILDMDTPGGALSATEKIDQALLKAGMPVYSYINPNAASAGALIALSTKQIYMAPVSAIGAAAPVMGSGQEMEATMNAKIVSYYSGYFRSVAAQNGHNPELVDAFMNVDKEVKVGDRVLNPKGALLTLSAQEAVEIVNDKPILAAGIADSVEDLCKKAGLSEQAIVRVEPSGFESLAQWITILAPMFLMGGMIGAWIEFKSPGFGVAGLLAAVCFLLFFTGHYVAGLTGFEVVAVFFLGVLLVLVELLFFPGVVFVAALGTALMLGSLFFAMVDYYPNQPLEFSFEAFAAPVTNLALGLGLAVVAAAILARFLPELPVFRKLILATASPGGTSHPAPVSSSREPEVAAGDQGVAYSLLRPAGKARFGTALVDVVTDGDFIDEGTPVRVLRAGADAIVVERA
jgi:membrane-bound serine protease (ClpP class)